MRIDDKVIQTEPGASVPVAVEIEPGSDSMERLELSVEGVAAEWTAIPVPTFDAAPGAKHVERFFFKPPRSAETHAGTYPFLVRIRSLDTGEAKTVQGALEVKPFYHLSVDAVPRKAVIKGGSKSTSVELTVMNLGNCSQAIQLYASDEDELLAFDLENEHLNLEPGQQKSLSLKISGRKSALLASPRLLPCTITARSIEQPSNGGSAQLHVEQRALIAPAHAATAAVVAILATAWVAMMPKAPEITGFSAGPQNLLEGEQTLISWTTEHAGAVEIKIGEGDFLRFPPTGNFNWKASESGDVRVTVRALREGRISDESILYLNVKEPERAGLPVIERFEITPTEVKVGQTIQVTYQFSDSVESAELSPIGLKLDPRANGVQLVVQVPGETEWKILARNKDNVLAEQSILITAEDSSLATIEKFEIFPEVIPLNSDGRITVSWRLTKAERAELVIGEEVVEIHTVSGRWEDNIVMDTQITLIAYDVNGKAVEEMKLVTIGNAMPLGESSEPEGPDPDSPNG